jgi:2-keto-3-deoxy-galactonokinase
MSKLTPDAYPQVLGGVLSRDLEPVGPKIDVLICGMAGARQGWIEAPYLDAPADLGSLSAGAVVPAMVHGRGHISAVPRFSPVAVRFSVRQGSPRAHRCKSGLESFIAIGTV